MKEGAFMSENKLLDLSFEFAVAIVTLVDGITAPIPMNTAMAIQFIPTSIHTAIPIFMFMVRTATTTSIIIKQCRTSIYILFN